MLLFSNLVFFQRKLADASFKSLQKYKEIKKELKYIVNYIKVSRDQ